MKIFYLHTRDLETVKQDITANQEYPEWNRHIESAEVDTIADLAAIRKKYLNDTNFKFVPELDQLVMNLATQGTPF
jgi:hypothetical protein